MATIEPFAALRPDPGLAGRICELPYDVLSSDEARERAAGNPFSFFRVSKPEIDLPATLDPYDPRVYEQGKRNFAHFLSEGWLRREPEPCLYLYRQVMGAHSQLGLVAVCSCEEYLQGVIRKHELTRPDKEEDRVRHMEALNAQTGPAFLAYRAEPTLNRLFAQYAAGMPEVDFTAPDGIRHSAWTLRRAADIELVQQAFAKVPRLYLADGHHRSAAAARVCQSRRGSGNSRYFLAVLFPHNQLQILPYNRVLKDLNGLAPTALLQRLQTVFTIDEQGAGQPLCRHELGLYLEGRWRTLRFRPELTAAEEPLDRLDVALLQRHVLGPVFGIGDPRTSERLGFVGGIRGTAGLEAMVNAGECACAFSLFPTGIEELMTVADAGEMMPPKSTWFEPKLRDAMFCHPL